MKDKMHPKACFLLVVEFHIFIMKKNMTTWMTTAALSVTLYTEFKHAYKN